MRKLVVLTMVMVVVLLSGATYLASESAAQTQQAQVVPKKASVDTNFDGKPDRTEYYDLEGKVTKVEVDANGDGKVEETVIYEEGKPVKSSRDTNGDGKPDVWMDF